jgi:bacteriocin-like protein
MFKKTKKEVASKAKVETLSNKELNNVVGGAVNYNASKSNSGNVTVGPNLNPTPVGPIAGNP